MTSAVESVVFNNTEECVAAGTRSGSIKVFDLAENKGRCCMTINPHCIPIPTLQRCAISVVTKLELSRYIFIFMEIF